MRRFIYVFTASDSRAMLEAGYYLLKADKANSIYIFDNCQPAEVFSILDIREYCLSDTLTF